MSNTKSNVGKSEETEEDCCCVIDSNETAPKKTGDFENDLIDENFNVEIDNGIAQSSVDSATDEEEDWELSTIKSQQFYNEGDELEDLQRGESPIFSVVSLSAPVRPAENSTLASGGRPIPLWEKFIPCRDHIVVPKATYVGHWSDGSIVEGQFDDAN